MRLIREPEPMIYEVVIGTRGPHTPRREVTLDDLAKFGEWKVIVGDETPVEDHPVLRATAGKAIREGEDINPPKFDAIEYTGSNAEEMSDESPGWPLGE